MLKGSLSSFPDSQEKFGLFFLAKVWEKLSFEIKENFWISSFEPEACNF